MDNTDIMTFPSDGDILNDMKSIIDISRDSAYQAVNLALVKKELAPRQKNIRRRDEEL